MQAQPNAYERHSPENTLLYQTIQENFESFVQMAQAKTESRPFPLHVYQEVDEYLKCGILAYGFTRLQCQSCRKEKLISFSCKRRGFCPSCGGRRMNEVAAHLVDSVLPHVSIRQWVLSLPFSVRYLLSYNPLLVTRVLSIFIRVVSNWYEKAARKNGAIGKTGAITFVQRSGSAANLNVHYHSLFVDGVYAIKNNKPIFIPVFPPSDDEIAILVQRINIRVRRLLGRCGLELTDFSEDPFAHEQPAFAEIVGASIQSRTAMGERAGKKVRRIGTGLSVGDAYIVGKRCAVSDGFSLHANVQIKADDRGPLEKLVRYTARPPLALERMSGTPDEKILYKLKTAYSDGTTHILFDRMELVEKVIALIPPPRANLLRYHGIFGANSKIRKLIVPGSKEKKVGEEEAPNKKKWAELLKRSFAIDILQCSACGGKMNVIATIKDALVIRKILEHLGLPSEPPRRMPPRAPPQMEMYSLDANHSQISYDYDGFKKTLTREGAPLP